MRITADTRLEEILVCEGIRDRAYMVDPGIDDVWEDITGKRIEESLGGRKFIQLTLDEMKNWYSAWDRQSMIEGLNYLTDKVAKGQVFYDIWDEEERECDPEKKQTGLAVFPGSQTSKYVLICPGGGYSGVGMMTEGYPAAKFWNKMGYGAFVLKYRTGFNRGLLEAPAEDVAQALRFIAAHKEKFHVNPEEYAISGFSAGGHLAGFFCTEQSGYKKYRLPKPEAAILAYPVITMGEKTDEGSRNSLLGDNCKDDLKYQEHYSVEKHVTAEYPPTFIWQCDRDNIVPIENSRMLVAELEHYGVKYQYEVFPSEEHGWGAGLETEAKGWIERAAAFWETFPLDDCVCTGLASGGRDYDLTHGLDYGDPEK